MSINRVVLTGRLTKDVELRATPSGASVASFTIAVDGFTKDQNNKKVVLMGIQNPDDLEIEQYKFTPQEFQSISSSMFRLSFLFVHSLAHFPE